MAPTILCIDDDHETYTTLAEGLESEGFELLYTDEPGDVPALIEEREPDLLVTEILLAKGDGLEMLETVLGGESEGPPVSVVVVTRAARSPVLYGRAVELGVKDYLVKPVLEAQLLETVREYSRPQSEGVDVGSVVADSEAREFSAEGSLADLPAGELLQGLHANGASGALIVENGKSRIGVHFRNGSPVAVSSARRSEPLQDYLLRTKQITDEQHQELADQVTFGMGSVREILIGMEALSDAEIDAAEATLAEGQLYRLFGWTSGKYRFHEGKSLKSDTTSALERSLPELLWKGVCDGMSDDQARALLSERGDFYPFAGDCPEELVDTVTLTRPQQKFLDELDGEKSLSEHLATGALPPRIFYAMTLVGWIELDSDAVMTLDDVVAEADPAKRPHEPRRPAIQEPEPKAAATESGPAAAPPHITGGLALRTQLQRARKQRKAAMAAKQDEKSKKSSQDSAKGQSEEGADAAARGLEAETWYRKGQGFLRKKEYGQAVEAYGMASHLDPKEGTYVAHLGWALYLSKPDDKLVRKEALEQIATGIKLSPHLEMPYVFLGRVFKATGEADTAEKMFRRALKIKPTCREALQEMRLINLRDQKKGLLGRLRKK